MRYIHFFFANHFPARLRYWCGGKGSLINCSDRDESERPQGFVARRTILSLLAAVFLAPAACTGETFTLGLSGGGCWKDLTLEEFADSE